MIFNLRQSNDKLDKNNYPEAIHQRPIEPPKPDANYWWPTHFPWLSNEKTGEDA